MPLHRLYIPAIILLLFSGLAVRAAPKLTIGRSPQREISVLVDPSFHARYGLTYPVTYRIGIPPNSRNLSAQSRHDIGNEWGSLTRKSSNDFFNGIEAVRFDYEANIAYTSVRFQGNSNLLMIRILDDTGRPVTISFQGICKYYDNRTAAVAISLDDWKTETLSDFRRALSLMRSFNLPMMVGVITGDVENEATWAEMQSEINVGDIEPAGHTRTHPRWPNYGDVVSEVAGCKTDLLDHLDFPPQYRAGNREYVFTWIAPYGETNPTIENAVTNAGYLNSRLVTGSTGDFKPWNASDNRYSADATIKEMGPPWGSTSQTDLDLAFNTMLAQGKIYHLLCHPYSMTENDAWEAPYVSGHLSTISNRKNVWYVTYGHLYVYHLLPDPATGSIVFLDAPPTITSNPTDQTVALGDRATFTIEASSQGPVSFQWQMNGVSIKDAGSHTYTTPPTHVGDNHASFRCIVNNPNGSDTSAEARLHLLCATVSAKVFLQGALSGDSMRTELAREGLLPRVQPYIAPPWHYDGKERMSIIPPGVVDWVLVELRAAPGAPSTVARRAGLLKTTGEVTDLDGQSRLAFPTVPPGCYYIVVRHRNHIAIMSAEGQELDAASALYDFTTNAEKYYGESAALVNGVMALFAGDADASGDIADLDREATWNSRNTTGYQRSDLDLSGDVTSLDRAIAWNNRHVAAHVPGPADPAEDTAIPSEAQRDTNTATRASGSTAQHHEPPPPQPLQGVRRTP